MPVMSVPLALAAPASSASPPTAAVSARTSRRIGPPSTARPRPPRGPGRGDRIKSGVELVDPAARRIAVVAPPLQLRAVADPMAAAVVEADLRDQLRPQGAPLEVAVGGPPAGRPGAALAALERRQ